MGHIKARIQLYSNHCIALSLLSLVLYFGTSFNAVTVSVCS